MRFLHTADWHIGKTLRGRHRDDEYAAALAEVLAIAVREQVDCVLVAGDLFDSASPPAEAERLVYEFFRSLWGEGISAVVIGGNHDHRRRLAAVSGLLGVIDVQVRAEPGELLGALVQRHSRDGQETALVATVPWLPERRVNGESHREQLSSLVGEVSRAFRPDTVNILLAHLLVDGALVGAGGGERPLHLGVAYSIAADCLPATAQYVALGHVHRPQNVVAPASAYYSGSLLQLDFGERGQAKEILLIEGHPGVAVQVVRVPLSAGKELRDVTGTLDELRALAGSVGDAFLRVFVKVDGPVAGIAEQVREILPNAVDVRRIVPDAPAGDRGQSLLAMGPEELFGTFYMQVRGSPPGQDVLALFRSLYGEESDAAS